MSYETMLTTIRALLEEPLRTESREAEQKATAPWPKGYRQPYECWNGAKGHVVVKLPADFGPSAHRILDTGYLCLTCETAFGGSMGILNNLRSEVPA